MSFDTDLIGPYGYCADISRSWVCGDAPPSNEQSRLHGYAVEQINHNKELLQPGASFKEVSEKGLGYSFRVSSQPLRFFESTGSASRTNTHLSNTGRISRRKVTTVFCARAWFYALNLISARKGVAKG